MTATIVFYNGSIRIEQRRANYERSVHGHGHSHILSWCCYAVMSYTPNVDKAIQDEANHQLAFGEPVIGDQHIVPDEISRTLIFEGDTAPLATDRGVILGHSTGNLFMRYASNGMNHMNSSKFDENDSLSMPDIKHDSNGMATMVETKEESDIVHSISIKNIKNDTGMDLAINILSVRAAGSTSFVDGCSTVSDIIVAGTDSAKTKMLYAPEMDEEVAEFAAIYFNSTATSVAEDVKMGGDMAAVRIGSPILHFHDNHEKGGIPVNVHSSKLPTEMHFGHPHAIMSRDSAKLYLKKTQQILNRFLAHADVCSKRFSVQVRRLQKNLAMPTKGKIGRLSFDIDIEYVNTRS